MKVAIDCHDPSDRGHVNTLIADLRNIDAGVEICVLNRCPDHLDVDAAIVDFPSYSPNRFNAADSILLQRVIDAHGIDILISPGTTPLRTPMLLVRFGDRPEPSGGRAADERALAWAYCEHIVSGGDGDEQMPPPSSIPAEYRHKVVSSLAECTCFDEAWLKRRSASGFFEQWSRLRLLQASVDPVLWD